MSAPLIWDAEEIKTLFQSHRIYPTYIGIKSADKNAKSVRNAF